MRLVFISDTHEQHEKVTIPPCDILIHCGDLTYNGDHSATVQAITWLHRQPAEHVVLIAGNHDWIFERTPTVGKEIVSRTRVRYLENGRLELCGFKFWGSPYTPRFMDWAFNCDEDRIYKHWDLIPADTDILITHGPPQGIQDTIVPFPPVHLGCWDLIDKVLKIKPKVHAFGHVHGGYGQREYKGIKFFNASLLDEAYRVRNAPHIADL
jgi:Icc-related predicted phosphoesterase